MFNVQSVNDMRRRHDGGARWRKGAFLLLRSVLSCDVRRKFPSSPPLLILWLRVSVVHQNLGFLIWLFDFFCKLRCRVSLNWIWGFSILRLRLMVVIFVSWIVSPVLLSYSWLFFDCADYVHGRLVNAAMGS